ncbi:uncharacterized protein LOC125508075 isoform X1 [Triticum urartu]|uniref:DUF629 domain-containing protein n=1 Tax=Triticum urartu TaxID=4572 RepID=A0A8R7QDP4_TRIUA|nr:uncharacterized protein LOC125508075 isoform X1 [Triticum urartu]
MANHEAAEAASIRNEAREILSLYSDGEHEAALARAVVLAAVHPGSAVALNLAGLIHRHAALVARNDTGAHGDDEDGDENASALEKYHRHAALDAFSAAARLAPNCVVTNADHAVALVHCRRFEDAQKEFLRMLDTVANNDQADPALYSVVYDMSGDSSMKGRKRDAVKSASIAMERFAEKINHRILPLEAAKLLDASNLGGPAADEAQERAKLLAETYPYSPRAQLLRAYIDLAPVRAFDPAMDKKQLLRRALTTVSQAAQNFDRSLMVALFHAKLLFVLDNFDAAERECHRALRMETPNDPNWDDIPPMAALGADSDARVSYVKKQLRVLLKQIIVVAALYWSSMKNAPQGQHVVSVTVHTLHAHYDGIDKSAAKTISDATRFLKNQESWSFWICLNSRCDGKKFLDTSSLWQHTCSKHRDELWGKLQSLIDPEYWENTSQGDHSLVGITLSRQSDTFLLPRVQDMFESLLLSPSVRIQAEPFAEMRQRKCREGSEILGSIREKLRMLPKDTLSTEFQECCSGIEKLWLKFLEVTVVDYREIILPLARSYQWIELKKRIPFYLNHPGTRHIGFADANIDIICGTSGQSVKEMASTSSCQQSLTVSNKNNADKELSILSVIIQSLCNLRHFRDKLLMGPLVWIPSVENPCIAQQFYEIFSSWEKNDHHLTDVVLTCMKTLLCRVVDYSTFYEKVGKTFASEIVATILIELHMSETCSRFRENKGTKRHVVNSVTCGDCICPTHYLFGIKFDAQISCRCGKSSGEYLYTTLFHKLDVGSPQTAKIKSFAELPVLLDEQFREDNKCDHCGSLQNIDLFLSNTPHFFTIVLNWLGGSESQDALSEVLAGITSPLDTEFFCRSAHSAAMYAVTSMICYADDRYVCFARDEDKWVIYGFETVKREDSWEHLLERFKDCKLQPEVLFFEVIK